jgi:predicted amidohydrolase YtcJ
MNEVPGGWKYGIEGLVTRQDPAGEHSGALWAEQAITLDEAIAVFTRNAAAMGLGNVTGSLEPGKLADYIVLDRDPFRTPASEVAHHQLRRFSLASGYMRRHDEHHSKTADRGRRPGNRHTRARFMAHL